MFQVETVYLSLMPEKAHHQHALLMQMEGWNLPNIVESIFYLNEKLWCSEFYKNRFCPEITKIKRGWGKTIVHEDFKSKPHIARIYVAAWWRWEWSSYCQEKHICGYNLSETCLIQDNIKADYTGLIGDTGPLIRSTQCTDLTASSCSSTVFNIFTN